MGVGKGWADRGQNGRGKLARFEAWENVDEYKCWEVKVVIRT